MSDARDAAEDYLEQGWAVVPVQPRDKNPKIKDWPELARRRDFKPHEFEGRNVGVVLGPVSGGLVDIDLDSAAALELAEYFLPPTRTFGRKSKRASHWVYYAKGARSDQLKFGPKERRELVEIRAQNKLDDECGHQSVFPGSVHESGERVEWDNPREHIAEVDAAELAWAVARLAVASVVLDGWTEGGGRNIKSLGITGGLLKMGWKADEVRDMMHAVRTVSGLDREDDRRAVENTIKNYEDGAEVTGFGALSGDGDLEPHDLKAIRKHGRTPTTRALEAGLAKSKLGRHGLREQLINEAREVDGMATAADAVAEMVADKPPERKRSRDEGQQIGKLGLEIDLTQEPPPLDYLCKGLGLASGKVSAIAGFGGTGKGPLLTWFALCVATGKKFLGHDVRRSRVAYFDFETGRLARIRVARMARAMGIDLAELVREQWFLFVDSSGAHISDDEWMRDLEILVEGFEPGLVCLDSYTSAVPGNQNESEYSNAAWSLGAMSNVRDFVVLGTFHENKGTAGKRTDDDMKAVAGNATLTAAMQTLWTLVRPDQNVRNTFELRCGRAPEHSFEPIAIEWHDVEQPEQSKGARMRTGGNPNEWGLEVRVVERKPAAARGSDPFVMTEAKLTIAKQVVRYLDNGEPGGKPLTKIRNAVTGGNTEIKNVVAQLVEDGVLDLDYELYDVIEPSRKNYQARLRWGLKTEGRD